jgi:REP element-mobilizing transposase RayT
VNLRTREVLAAFERSAKIAKRADFGIVHFSLQGNHLHLIVESKNNQSLARGMRSLGCSLGKSIRKLSRSQGSVFADRYHLRVLKTPTETRRAFIYVLQNRSRHTRSIYHLDEYSSAPYFDEWRKLLGGKAGPVLRDRSERELLLPDHLAPPRSWLAQQGWKNATDS